MPSWKLKTMFSCNFALISWDVQHRFFFSILLQFLIEYIKLIKKKKRKCYFFSLCIYFVHQFWHTCWWKNKLISQYILKGILCHRLFFHQTHTKWWYNCTIALAVHAYWHSAYRMVPFSNNIICTSVTLRFGQVLTEWQMHHRMVWVETNL